MNVIITGASRGIGFELAKAFLNDGLHKVTAFSRNLGGLERLKNEVRHPENLSIVKFDIADYETSDLDKHLAHFDQVDVVVNNAGMLINKPFSETDQADWKQTFEVNLFAPARLIHDLVPKLKRSEAAHIVNIGSMGGFQGSMKFPGLSAYSASKAALACLTECLAEELKEFNISANCLCLGAVNTEMLRGAFPDYAAPLESVEMADFICQFALNNHKFINGKVLPISVSTP